MTTPRAIVVRPRPSLWRRVRAWWTGENDALLSVVRHQREICDALRNEQGHLVEQLADARIRANALAVSLAQAENTLRLVAHGLVSPMTDHDAFARGLAPVYTDRRGTVVKVLA